VLLNSMHELPSLGNVSRVVVDETIIEGEAEPRILYENLQQAVGASDWTQALMNGAAPLV
jgi:ATP-dependent Clp protease ATP-binding subunit ClpX